ncbi:unannotated protein [freshwater metagenome]|uniref:Unannotated protein n=1 Tax=freshwater metagenome TaxID=449393 RepID=A0A6J5YE07_9ZZZZ
MPVDRNQQPASVRARKRCFDELGLIAEHGDHGVARYQATGPQCMHQAGHPRIELDPRCRTAVVDDRRLITTFGNDRPENSGHGRTASSKFMGRWVRIA